MSLRQEVKAQDFDSCIEGSNPAGTVCPTRAMRFAALDSIVKSESVVQGALRRSGAMEDAHLSLTFSRDGRVDVVGVRVLSSPLR